MHQLRDLALHQCPDLKLHLLQPCTPPRVLQQSVTGRDNWANASTRLRRAVLKTTRTHMMRDPTNFELQSML
eukprot:4176286-Amphidinium_carterae.1